MAEPSDARRNILASVWLTEDDIPGAKLPKGSSEEFNCWMLTHWLQYRGGRITGEKVALVQRYIAEVEWIFVKQKYSMVNLNLQQQPFFSVKDMKINHKIIDPDGGVNLAKKNAHLGLCENISPEFPDEFPTGYNNDLSDVPNVDYNMRWKFIVQTVRKRNFYCQTIHKRI